MQVGGVQGVEAWSGAAAEILDPQDNPIEDLNIIAPPADTPLLEPDMISGRWIQPGDQRALAVSDAIYDTYPDLQPGDQLIVDGLQKIRPGAPAQPAPADKPAAGAAQN